MRVDGRIHSQGYLRFISVIFLATFWDANGFFTDGRPKDHKSLSAFCDETQGGFRSQRKECHWLATTERRKCPHSEIRMSYFGGGSESDDQINTNASKGNRWAKFALFSGTGFLYWYLMVFAAAAQANGLPVPDFIPMTPGWPTTDADFVPVLEDSYHFFYLSELLHNEHAPHVIPPRLAIFNIVEAWIFAMLPALWMDTKRRLPRPILLGSWALLGVNLTNAFLAPYLAITELRSSENEAEHVSASFAAMVFLRAFTGIAASVVAYALYQSLVMATASDWSAFWELAQTDRSYLAFCVDPLLFAVFQPMILARLKSDSDTIDYVPFVGLIAWLLSPRPE